MRGNRLVGKPSFIERLVEKIAGTVAGENSSRSIPAMSGGRETQNQELRLRIAEARDRLAPVVPVHKRTAFLRRYLFAIADKPGTFSAAYDPLIQLVECLQILSNKINMNPPRLGERLF